MESHDVGNVLDFPSVVRKGHRSERTLQQLSSEVEQDHERDEGHCYDDDAFPADQEVRLVEFFLCLPVREV